MTSALRLLHPAPMSAGREPITRKLTHAAQCYANASLGRTGL